MIILIFSFTDIYIIEEEDRVISGKSTLCLLCEILFHHSASFTLHKKICVHVPSFFHTIYILSFSRNFLNSS